VNQEKWTIEDLAGLLTEMQAKCLSRNMRDDTPYALKSIYAAALSPLSDAAFRVYVARHLYADWKTGKNCLVSQATIAEIIGKKERSVRSADAEL